MGELRSVERLTPHLVHAALGVLLLAAAGLKLYGLNVSPFAQYGWLTAPWVQMLAVGWEVVLGLWLLSGAYRAGAWVATVGTFATFAAVSGYLGWIGQASCGCFGVIQASPWHAFAVDVTALALLAVARPDWRAARAELFRAPIVRPAHRLLDLLPEPELRRPMHLAPANDDRLPGPRRRGRAGLDGV